MSIVAEWRVHEETPEGAATEEAQLERFAESLEQNDDALGAAASMDTVRGALSATFHVGAPNQQEAAWKAFWALPPRGLGRRCRPDGRLAARSAGGVAADAVRPRVPVTSGGSSMHFLAPRLRRSTPIGGKVGEGEGENSGMRATDHVWSGGARPGSYVYSFGEQRGAGSSERQVSEVPGTPEPCAVYDWRVDRLSLRLLLCSLVLTLATGCAFGDEDAPPRPDAGSTSRSAAQQLPAVDCSRSILSVASGHAGGYRVVLGVISVPPAFGPQVVRRPGQSNWPYFRKAGLVVRGGSPPMTVTVPRRWRSRVAIEWGNTGVVSALRVASCGANPEKPWNAFAGGFYLRSPSACVPLIFRVAGRSSTVRFGLAEHCR